MIVVKADKDCEAGLPPKPELLGAIGKPSHDMVRAGMLVETGGLLSSSRGARVRASGSKLSVTDGPGAETKELVGGYAIVQAKSRAARVELGKQFMEVHVAVLGSSYDGECEIRQLFDASDCAPER